MAAMPRTLLAATAGLLAAAVPPAQSGQIAAGAHLGPGSARAAGDVDDDGHGDLVFDLGTTWEVRSGATGLAFPLLTRVRTAPNELYEALLADLDADGCDDLVFVTPAAGTAEFRSGRDGSLLFAFQHPNFGFVPGAADHDADGADDVMVTWLDPVTGIAHTDVLSGRNGAVIDSYQSQNTATSQQWWNWVGDVDGDGFVDLCRNQNSFAQRFHYVAAGPDWQRGILWNGQGIAYKAFDTNADGRDDLLTDFGYLDAVTGQLVWPGFSFVQALPMDLDGDGAFDLFDNGQALSGRSHAPFAGAVSPSAYPIGDIDGDGRDEAVASGIVHELVGVPPASIVRDRGASGTTSTGSRPRIRNRLRPRFGDTMLVDLTGGIANGLAFFAFGTALDLDLATFGAPGNRAYTASFATIAHATDGFGHARQPVAVPVAPALLGTSLSLQWAVVDPGFNALGIATSNALDITIGN